MGANPNPNPDPNPNPNPNPTPTPTPNPDPDPDPDPDPNPNPSLYTGCSSTRLRLAHFIRQSSIQAQFGWHQDHDENRDHWAFTASMISVIILLSGHDSGMQVWGFQAFQYSGAGAAAVFPGAATHRSVCREPGAGAEGGEEVVKVALFFE